ncbi:hypothetical protein GJR96_09055 [Haloferax sp. MBLA0076]|uniref:Uncharacterized protein n=1 Tax=Haloferax litoreum TaxID=2666140 RepID=A0A6A8GI02_9EURY|nr:MULTISPECIES: hypothetical protein [Haloferax]KAB1193585.1 hypothetical protein Hfx1148_09040 [Haloferax sp. CBA1148]MRX22102.1 hypothetical protein [Haloferax litoreum]
MSIVLGGISFDLLYGLTAVVFVVALAVAAARWRVMRNDDEARPPEQQPEESYGYPLASWRYVYDLDKADAERAVKSVHEQAETLSEAEKQRKR